MAKPQREGPTHLIAVPGDRKSLCGVKKPLPVCWFEAAPKHRYEHERCPTCYKAAGLEWMLKPARKVKV